MFRKILCIVAASTFFWAVSADAADLVLAADGRSEYQIIVPDNPPAKSVGDCLAQVARLVQTAFKANGCDVPVVPEAQRDVARPGIYLGDTAFARARGVDVAKLDGWGYVHKVVGRDLILAGRDVPAPGKGGNRRGVSYDRVATAKAAADFLRLYAGTRFLYPDLGPWSPLQSAASVDLLKTPTIEFLPTPTIQVPADLNVQRTAPVRYNFSYAQGSGFYDIANNRYPIVDEVFGGHTWARAVPPEKYAREHPEYFALVGKERLTWGPGQYCISNPEVQELMYQDLIQWLDAGYETVDLGQPDGFRACQCEGCKNLFNTGADWDEKIWILHRNLAERVLAARPGRQVSIMSYINTAWPPKSFKTFPKNVRIMLTGTNEEDIAPWRQVDVPCGFTGYIYNWCPNLGTRYTPMRTPRYVETQVRRLVANRIQSLYRDGPGALYGLEGPVYYTMGRLFDDAQNIQAKDLVQEFCGASFGKAGPAMMRFYDRLYHGIELYSEFLGTRSPGWSYKDIYGRGHKYLSDPFQFIGFLYTPDLLESLEKELAQAEKQGDSEKALTRLALVRREFNYIKSLARVVHLHQAYRIQPDLASRDRLLDAIDARNAEINSYFGDRGRTKPAGGWTYTLFPMPGHDANHLRLAHDGYQEPYKNTCFNWDTKAMRQAALPGSKRLAVRPAGGTVTMDAPAWDRAAPVTLGALPVNAEVTRKTTVRALYEPAALCLRIESELPADAMKTLSPQEAIEIYLLPPSGKEIIYRFTVGPKADSKQDAANGLVADVMDPRHGQFDPDWNGEWTYETRLDAEKGRWLALVRVPFKTLDAEPSPGGSTWRGNIGRVHPAASNRAERSLWSALPNTRVADDRNAFGEIAFETAAQAAAAGQPQKSPLQEWRETYYKKTFETPAEWRNLKDVLPTPPGPWLFRIDPLEQGVKEAWFGPQVKAADWLPARVPGFWAETEGVGNYQGYGWYRTVFTVPAEWQGRTVRVLFGAVDEQAWVYVNGKLVREHSVKSEGKSINDLWEEPFAAEVAPAGINYGKANVLAVRVNNSLANGGIWRPVLVNAVDKK